MTLDQAQLILDKAFKKHHRAWMVYQRASSYPSESDVIKILTNGDYVSILKTKEAQHFADIQFWEDRIKDESYKTFPFNNYKKYYNIK